MVCEFHYQRSVSFAEVDMAGVVHFSRFFMWMEETEHCFFRSLNLPIVQCQKASFQGWPRVQAQCHYLRPAHFHDTLSAHLIIRALNERSIDYGFLFHRYSSLQQKQHIATGLMTTMPAIRVASSDALKGQPLPENIRKALQPAPSHLLAPFKSIEHS